MCVCVCMSACVCVCVYECMCVRGGVGVAHCVTKLHLDEFLHECYGRLFLSPNPTLHHPQVWVSLEEEGEGE